ncbi:hypothetical protein AWB82_05398 [Caballeronia glebae]|jgi:hypothetical protein|uniref:Uncharacterized protein n=1 Tax=Caballeronia glebae TaxID=1777143 RepID=A0A158CI44_9BURK|nr:hypothetical protein AWB82_05398 [Caballeronia glebae]
MNNGLFIVWHTLADWLSAIANAQDQIGVLCVRTQFEAAPDGGV